MSQPQIGDANAGCEDFVAMVAFVLKPENLQTAFARVQAAVAMVVCPQAERG